MTAPASAATMRIQLHNEMNNGWVAFDDVSLAGKQPTSYYFFGAQRVAMRSTGVDGEDMLYWLAGDHLGTTSLVMNERRDARTARAGTIPTARSAGAAGRYQLIIDSLGNVMQALDWFIWGRDFTVPN